MLRGDVRQPTDKIADTSSEATKLRVRGENQFSKADIGRQRLEVFVALGLNTILRPQSDGLFQVLQSAFGISA
jgi:hypothetical protein